MQNIVSYAFISFIGAANVVRVAANESAIIADQLASAKGTTRSIRLGASPIEVGRNPLYMLLATIPLERIKLFSILSNHLTSTSQLETRMVSSVLKRICSNNYFMSVMVRQLSGASTVLLAISLICFRYFLSCTNYSMNLILFVIFFIC
jgi:hypothetical protein